MDTLLDVKGHTMVIPVGEYPRLPEPGGFVQKWLPEPGGIPREKEVRSIISSGIIIRPFEAQVGGQIFVMRRLRITNICTYGGDL